MELGMETVKPLTVAATGCIGGVDRGSTCVDADAATYVLTFKDNYVYCLCAPNNQ